MHYYYVVLFYPCKAFYHVIKWIPVITKVIWTAPEVTKTRTKKTIKITRPKYPTRANAIAFDIREAGRVKREGNPSTGKKVLDASIKANDALDVSQLHNGIYIIKFDDWCKKKHGYTEKQHGSCYDFIALKWGVDAANYIEDLLKPWKYQLRTRLM